MLIIPFDCVSLLLYKSFPSCVYNSISAGPSSVRERYNLKLSVAGLGYTSAIFPLVAFSFVYVSYSFSVRCTDSIFTAQRVAAEFGIYAGESEIIIPIDDGDIGRGQVSARNGICGKKPVSPGGARRLPF